MPESNTTHQIIQTIAADPLESLHTLLGIIAWLIGALAAVIVWIGIRLHNQVDKIFKVLTTIHDDSSKTNTRIEVLETKFTDHVNNHFIIDRRKMPRNVTSQVEHYSENG
jgi:hypothetical protein